MVDIADFLQGQPPAATSPPRPGSGAGAFLTADQFMGGGTVQSSPPETEPEKLNFVERFKEDIDKRVLMFAEIQKATEEGDQSFGEAILQTAGKVGAGAVLDFITEGLVSGARGLSLITPDVIEMPMRDSAASTAMVFMNTTLGQAGLLAAQEGAEAWQEWSTQHPRAARNIESVVNIAALVTPAKGKASSKPVSGPATPPRVDPSTGLPTGASASGTTLGRTADRLTQAADAQTARSRTEYLEKMVRPKQTPTAKRDQVPRSTEEGVLRTRVIEASPAERRAVEQLMDVEGVRPGQSLLANATVIRREVSDEAQKLEDLLNQSPAKISAREVDLSLQRAQERILAQPLIVGDAARVAERLAQEARRLASKQPNTSAGVLKARREFDRFVESQRGDSVFDPSLENATSIAVREVRQTMNELIAVKNPSVGVRDSLGRQSNLYTALDNMGPKIADMYNNAILRAWQNAMSVLPFRGEFNQLAATVAGVGGLGASAKFAPMFTALAGLTAVSYVGGKLLMGPGAKRVLARLVRQTDSAIQAATDPVMISTLRADRALVLEALKQAEGAAQGSEEDDQ